MKLVAIYGSREVLVCLPVFKTVLRPSSRGWVRFPYASATKQKPSQLKFSKIPGTFRLKVPGIFLDKHISFKQYRSNEALETEGEF